MNDPNDALNAELIYRHDLTPYIAIVRVRPDTGSTVTFEPGQFIMAGLPRDPADAPPVLAARPRKGVRLIRRAYSIASAPEKHDYYELLVALVEDGRLTPKLWPLETGNRLWIDHKVGGAFTMQNVPEDRDLVMIATGTGLAPYVSMLRTYAQRAESDPLRWRSVTVVHGVRIESDLAYRDELEQLCKDDPTVRYLPIISREPDSQWTGVRGRVQQVIENADALLPAPLNPDTSQVFLCGNPDMITTCLELLEARNFRVHKHTSTEPGNIHFERYW